MNLSRLQVKLVHCVYLRLSASKAELSTARDPFSSISSCIDKEAVQNVNTKA